MCMVTLFVGLDYHPLSVQVCVMDSLGKVLMNATRGNDAAEIDRVVRSCGAELIRAGIEVSPGAAHLAHELETRFGWSIDLGHPGYVSRMRQSPDKTDFADAKLLADLMRVGYLPKVWLAPAAIQDLRAVTRHRAELAAQKRATKLRVRALLRQNRQTSAANAWTKAWLQWVREGAAIPPHSRWVLERHLREIERLTAELKIIEKRLAEITAESQFVQFLLQQHGIGLVTAVTLLAELGRVDRFRNGKQLSRFCGVSPRNASSGSRQADAGLVKASNPELRRILIEAAQRLMNYDERWHEFKEQMRERGKPYCLIVAAVANRWLRRMYHPLKTLAG
jgi:transposase